MEDLWRGWGRDGERIVRGAGGVEGEVTVVMMMSIEVVQQHLGPLGCRVG